MADKQAPTEPTLEQFTQYLVEAVPRFRTYWLKNRAEAPNEHWPLQMWEGDWHEAFIMWLSDDDKRAVPEE